MHMYNFLCSDSLLYFFLFLSTLHSVYTRDCSWRYIIFSGLRWHKNSRVGLNYFPSIKYVEVINPYFAANSDKIENIFYGYNNNMFDLLYKYLKLKYIL